MRTGQGRLPGPPPQCRRPSLYLGEHSVTEQSPGTDQTDQLAVGGPHVTPAQCGGRVELFTGGDGSGRICKETRGKRLLQQIVQVTSLGSDLKLHDLNVQIEDAKYAIESY